MECTDTGSGSSRDLQLSVNGQLKKPPVVVRTFQEKYTRVCIVQFCALMSE